MCIDSGDCDAVGLVMKERERLEDFWRKKSRKCWYLAERLIELVCFLKLQGFMKLLIRKIRLFL
jgi:hypothetical protein